MTIVDDIELALVAWLEGKILEHPTLLNWRVMRSWDDTPSEGPELVVTCSARDVICDEQGIARAGDVDWAISVEQPYDGQGLSNMIEARGVLQSVLFEVSDAWSRWGEVAVTHNAEAEPVSDGMRYISTFSGNVFLNF